MNELIDLGLSLIGFLVLGMALGSAISGDYQFSTLLFVMYLTSIELRRLNSEGTTVHFESEEDYYD